MRPGPTCPAGRAQAAALLLVAAAALAGCLVTAGESRIAAWKARVEGMTVTLEEPLFGFKVIQTGLWRPCLFQKTIGFGIYETTTHDPGRIPVLFLHGHADGPGGLKELASALDAKRFEPLFAFFPTGQKLSVTVSAMEARLMAFARARGIERMAIVAYSMSGIIARKALGNLAGRKNAPAVPAFITLSTPWGGSERGARWSWSPAAPPSWKDMSPDSDFLRHLFDRPLPGDTAFHVLYSTAGEKKLIPGDDDGVISVKSATRKEALAEADSVSVFPDSTHQGIVKDKKPLARVVELLAGI
jgi:pimeloyl-ACP methyl ester carboxylesterase